MSRREQGAAVPALLLAPLAIIAVALLLAYLVPAPQREPERAESAAPAPLERFTNSLGMTLVRLPAGSFVMGDESLGYGPERQVRVGSFFIATHEVTQAQWQAVMGYNPSAFPGPNRPVEQVSWDEVQAFLEQLNLIEGTNRYRLPSEAEWEYAARAGTSTPYFFGSDAGPLRRFAWFGASGNRGTRAAGTLQPNPWGLFDIYGNVWEWVQDCWHDDYRGAPPDARVWGSLDCGYRVVRGGGWNNRAEQLGSAVRGSYDARFGDVSSGFRVAY